MPAARSDRRLVRVLKALADANRFRMVQEIAAAGELCCTEVAAKFSLAQPTVSHHLAILRAAGVVKFRALGRHNMLSVDHELLAHVVAALPVRIAEPKRRRSTSRAV